MFSAKVENMRAVETGLWEFQEEDKRNVIKRRIT